MEWVNLPRINTIIMGKFCLASLIWLVLYIFIIMFVFWNCKPLMVLMLFLPPAVIVIIVASDIVKAKEEKARRMQEGGTDKKGEDA